MLLPKRPFGVLVLTDLRGTGGPPGVVRPAVVGLSRSAPDPRTFGRGPHVPDTRALRVPRTPGGECPSPQRRAPSRNTPEGALVAGEQCSYASRGTRGVPDGESSRDRLPRLQEVHEQRCSELGQEQRSREHRRDDRRDLGARDGLHEDLPRVRAQDVASPRCAGDDAPADRHRSAAEASAGSVAGPAARVVRGRAGREPLVGWPPVDRACAALDAARTPGSLVVLTGVSSVRSNCLETAARVN